jgi:hypothetical protein
MNIFIRHIRASLEDHTQWEGILLGLSNDTKC